MCDDDCYGDGNVGSEGWMTSVSTEIYEATWKFTCFYSKGARGDEILVTWMFLPNGCLKFNVNEALEIQDLQVLGQRFIIWCSSISLQPLEILMKWLCWGLRRQ